MGDIDIRAIKRKARLVDYDIGMSSNLVDITILFDDLLLSLASKCDIDMGMDKEEQAHNLADIRAKESFGKGDMVENRESS